ncbi:hypothetical protein LD125_00315 [Mesoplasma sp. JKS002658]|uniref:lipoprotein n=1 Tax=Mesoplasma whartonense TaxID=2878854 RepID=UPI002022A2EE|nr:MULTISPECIES: lipoprotein [unclassified Mesoplasma]MCL8211181.1 hypothetical protein [Mesoplasma sp. JKS002664]MCL8211842.1 hypothetical protein [Mesoplasma sp. JKS002662]MCL8214053.1 hypothetical protein [Mesoplasma sp. JKS002658]MCL8214519.1 hypothetical protein [Mesoplasma sp. JKS002663]MCL8215372.1 hypothetical protein [Mesoplasma sp. JKS002659]
MKKWLTILSAVGISATSSSSVLACTYKASSPVNYQKFTDFNAKNFNKLGEGKILLYPQEGFTPQSIKDYYEGAQGSLAVKNLIASSFANYNKAVEILSDSSMSVMIQNVQSIDDQISGAYEATFQVQQKTDSFTKKSELLSFKVVSGGSYKVLSNDNDTLSGIAGATKITDDINNPHSIFQKDFLATAKFLLSLNPVDRQNLQDNGVMSLNHWGDTTNNFNNHWIAALKTGTSNTGTFYLPGVDQDGKQYQSINAQINDSELGVKNWRSKFILGVVTVVLNYINNGTITNSNYQQIGLYQLDAAFASSLPPNLTITNTGVTGTATLESNQ